MRLGEEKTGDRRRGKQKKAGDLHSCALCELADGVETTRICGMCCILLFIFPYFTLYRHFPEHSTHTFLNLPRNLFFGNKFYSPTTDPAEVWSLLLEIAVYDLPQSSFPESSCQAFKTE